MTKKDLQQALPRFTQFVRRFGPLLEDDTRVARAEAYLRGLLLDADDNKNAETIALNAYGGDTSQVRMTQHFLGQSPWPDLPLRAELVRWVDDALGDAEGVLIVDESGVAKCGDKSVGVARQYCGATGKIDNCQIGSFWPTPAGTAIPCWTLACTCPRRNGPRTRPGGRRPVFLPKWSSAPSRSWPPSCCWDRGRPSATVGSRLMKGTAKILASWAAWRKPGNGISGRFPRVCASGGSAPWSKNRGVGEVAARGTSRGSGPISRPRRRWSSSWRPCPRGPGNDWPFAKRRKEPSRRSSRVCG